MSVCARVISIMDILRHHKNDMDIYPITLFT